MNLFESDPKKARENIEARRRAEMEACPEPLKPYLAAVNEVRERAIRAITLKNRELAHLQELERSIEGLATDEERKGREEIEAARHRFEEEERRCDAIKEECRRIEEEYARQVLEYRIRDVPESRREEARALLGEEQETMRGVPMNRPAESGQIGSAGGTFIGLDLRIKEAERRGDQETLARLLPLREKAKANLEKFEKAIERRNERLQEIHRDYAARLQALIDGAAPE